MPPVLHPRSRSTLSLFTTTLAMSFVVVALPHILPCPVPHRSRTFAEGEMPGAVSENALEERMSTQEESTRVKTATYKSGERECPVPKPSGLVGQILGFERKENRPSPIVRVESYNNNRLQSRKKSEDD